MTETLRITIVTYNWPPRNAIGVHRPYGWAKHWAAAGHRVRVLTAQKHLYDAPLDLQLPPLPGVEVIELPYGGGAASLTGAISASPVGAIAKRLYQTARGVSGAAPDVRDGWRAACRPQAKRLAAETDILVSTFGPRSSHLIAADLKSAEPRLFWLADFRDLWSQNHTSRLSRAAHRHEQRMELVAVRTADLISSVSAELAVELEALHRKPTIVIPNGFDVPESQVLEVLRAPRPSRGLPLKIVYTGKIYPNLRDPTPLLQAVLQAEERGLWPRGAVEVHFYGGQLEGIEAAERGAVGHFVRVHGHVSRDVAIQAQREAGMLLLLESPLPEARGVLTGKLFEYLSTGIPILSLGSGPDSAIARVIDETKAGVCAGADAQKIVDVIDAVAKGGDPPEFDPKEEEILRYARSRQAEHLLGCAIAERERSARGSA